MGWYGRLEQDGLGIGVGMIFYPFFFFSFLACGPDDSAGL